MKVHPIHEWQKKAGIRITPHLDEHGVPYAHVVHLKQGDRITTMSNQVAFLIRLYSQDAEVKVEGQNPFREWDVTYHDTPDGLDGLVYLLPREGGLSVEQGRVTYMSFLFDLEVLNDEA